MIDINGLSYDYCLVSELLGKTLTRVEKIADDAIEFCADDGSQYVMFHDQDCCEHVSIEDINGELDWLVGSPIVLAEESTNKDSDPPGVDVPPDHWRESWTWTFYRIATEKGLVVIRWYGESNGYYSEKANFVRVHPRP